MASVVFVISVCVCDNLELSTNDQIIIQDMQAGEAQGLTSVLMPHTHTTKQ